MRIRPWLILLLLILPPPANAEVAAKKKYYVIGCAIVDESFQRVRVFPGRFCVFLPDGSYVSAGTDGVLRRVSSNEKEVWERKLTAHHQMKLSPDGKRLILLASEIEDSPFCTARYDVLEVLDPMSGASLYHWSSSKHGKELYQFEKHGSFTYVPRGGRAGLDFECEPFHFNAIYEIPPNTLSATNPAFSPGNYIVSALGLNAVFILDSEMKTILWEHVPPDAGSFHDVQVTPAGNILFYFNGDASQPPGRRVEQHLSLWDPISRRRTWRYPRRVSEPPSDFDVPFGGGVQLVEEGFLFSVNHAQGRKGTIYLVNKDGRIIKEAPAPYRTREFENRSLQDIKEVDVASFLSKNTF